MGLIQSAKADRFLQYFSKRRPDEVKRTDSSTNVRHPFKSVPPPGPD